MQWLRDGLQIIENAEESETIANSTEDKDVYVVPAFAGLGTPIGICILGELFLV